MTYPDRDEAFGKVKLVLSKQPDGAMQISEVPIPPMPDELKRIIEEQR